jgi:hypothetical protein
MRPPGSLGPPGPPSSCRPAPARSGRLAQAVTTNRIVIGERGVSHPLAQMTASIGNGTSDTPTDRGSVHLHAEARARVDLERVPGTLRASAWLGEEIARDDRGMRRLAGDLVLGVGTDRPVAFRKSMIVGLGQPRRDGETGAWTVPIEWQAASLTPLFPVFVGHVTVDLERVAIDGHYAPPFGVIGVVLDRALLGIAARATAKVILRKFVNALTRT